MADHSADDLPIDHQIDEILGDSGEAVIVIDAAGAVTFASGGLAATLGIDRKDLVGISMLDFLEPEDVELAATLLGPPGPRQQAEMSCKLRHASGEWLSVFIHARSLTTSGLGVTAIHIFSDEGIVARESLLRRQLATEQYCGKLAADLVKTATQEDVIERLERSQEEVASLTNAHVTSIFFERNERHNLQRIASWITPEYQTQTQVTAVSTTEFPEVIERLLSETYAVEDINLDKHRDIKQIVTRHGLQVTSLISVPFTAGDRRGAFISGRYDGQHTWRFVDAQMLRGVAALYGSALERAQVDQLWELMYKKGPIGLAIRTEDGELVQCNDRYLELSGISQEQARENNIFDIIHPDDGATMRRLGAEFSAGTPVQFQHEQRVILENGETRWVRMTASSLDAPGLDDEFFLIAVEDVDDRVRARFELEHAATHDPLTGVHNRTALFTSLAEFERDNGHLPDLLLLDLDRFKLVNDSRGHGFGDRILQAVIERIVQIVADPDYIARLGGDEFAVIPPPPFEDEPDLLATAIHQAMQEPLLIDDRSLLQTVSIGIAAGAPCTDASELLSHADRAMYAAKTQGRNRHIAFDASLRAQMVSDIDTERDLRTAAANGELEVYFQPEFDLDDMRIVGAEALLRWNHPTRGLLRAGQFIELAEQAGYIDDISQFVLHDACQTFRNICEAASSNSLHLRVNISGREFSEPGLTTRVQAALDQSGLTPDRLCIEITETTLMENPAIATTTLGNLRAMGVTLAIDDFGRGFSSLAYLKQYEVDALKIDRSFVTDIATNHQSRSIAESILTLAHALGLEAVAEGIDDEQQRSLLHELGCTRGQGHIVAPALTREKFIELLLNR